MKNNRIAFIGCGNMAGAIIGGLVEAGWPVELIIASNPTNTKLEKLNQQYQIEVTNDNLKAAEFAQIIVLAVKPQKFPMVCQQLSTIDLSDKLIISIAAGVETNTIVFELKQKLAIVRCMPNTPSLIGLGASGLFANDKVSEAQKAMTDIIFKSVGQTTWINDEAKMNVVTAIAGSSPAYFFLMMQAMVEQAVESGLSPQDAFDLVTQSASGAAQLAQNNKTKSLQMLRQEVTSPGGTTAAAIQSFQHNDFENIVKNAVKASISRGFELGQKK